MHQSRLPTPVTTRRISEHDRLCEETETLLDEIGAIRPGSAVDGVLLALVRRALADTARLVSREPGGRALTRLPDGSALPVAGVRAAIEDAQRALAAFRRAHGWQDEETGETLWLTPTLAASTFP